MSRAAASRFAAALSELESELDWRLLGELHCHEGGEAFYPPEQRLAMREAGLRFAADVAEALEGLPSSSPARSLYLGASVAELAPMLCELAVLGREVALRRLPDAESEELARAFDAVGARLGQPMPAISTDVSAPIARGAFDHLWMVSVLTDPQAFPGLHDELYGRQGTERATGVGDAADDRRRAQELVEAALAGLARRALLTTSDEELAFFEAACERAGRELRVPERARLSGVVGDAIRHCGVAPRPMPAPTRSGVAPETRGSPGQAPNS